MFTETPSHGCGRHRVSNPAAALLCLLLALFAALPTAALAGQPESPPPGIGYSHKGLGHFVPLPEWAKHAHVHFLPTAESAKNPHSFTPPSSQLGVREGESGPLVYFNKSGYGVQHTVKIYPIFWGKNWTKEPGLAVKADLMKMLEGLSGSNYQGILNQYFDQSGRVSKTVEVATPYIDESVGAPSNVSEETVIAEAAKAIKEKGWSREARAQFPVMMAPGSTYAESGFCAYHYYDAEKTNFSFIPYVGDKPFAEGCLGYDKSKNISHVEQMVLAHEYAESATDPVPGSGTSTWITSYGSEISDICASGADELPNGTWAQGNWDNYQNGCSLSDPSPPEAWVWTERPTEVEPNSGVLNGTVFPEGHESEYRFEWGTTAEYGNATSWTKVSPGAQTDSSQAVSQKLTGLSTNTRYHYRLVLKNTTGTYNGLDRVLGISLWTMQETPELSGNRWPLLNDVSCPTQSFCMAVGEESIPDGLGTRPKNLAEKWDGTSWSVVPTPNNENFGRLESISCPSENWCMAVGNNAQWRYSVVWNGSSWTAVTPANPDPKSVEARLRGVWCKSSSWCVGVGTYSVPNPYSEWYTLVEVWNGTSWTVQSTIKLSEPGRYVESPQLKKVSCSSESRCMAVGEVYESKSEEEIGAVKALVLSSNGTTWTVDPSPPQGELPESHLTAVACPTAEFCLAAGKSSELGKPYGDEKTARYSATWRSGKWEVGPIGGQLERIDAISCVSANWCTGAGWTAVAGSFRGQVGVGHWNGREWVEQEAFLPTAGESSSEFFGVSCPSIATCTGVGTYGAGDSYTGFTLAERVGYTWPTATTGQAYPGESSTEVTGTVNPAGSETSYLFEYGTTTAYGSKAPASPQNIGAGTSEKTVAQVLTNYPAGTVHYRLVATNALGTTYGEDRTFTAAQTSYPSAVLCKASESPCKEASRYGSGTSLSAALKSGTKSVIETSFKTLECSSSALAGSLSGAGGIGKAVPYEVSSASFGGCNATFTPEALPWHGYVTRTEGGNEGTLHLTDPKIKVVASTIFGNVTCYYGGPLDLPFTSGAPAEFAAGKTALAVLSGSSGLCSEKHSWSAAYSLSAPNPAYLRAPLAPGSTVLCKAAEEHCAEANRYGSGTSLSAALKGGTKLVLESATFGKFECGTATLAGSLNGAGGTNQVVPLELSAASFSCSGTTITAETLPWKGYLSRSEPLGSGIARLSGIKLKAVSSTIFGNITCYYGGQLGLTAKGGNPAELSVSKAQLEVLSGSNGLCNAKDAWSATWSLSAPNPAYVEST